MQLFLWLLLLQGVLVESVGRPTEYPVGLGDQLVEGRMAPRSGPRHVYTGQSIIVRLDNVADFLKGVREGVCNPKLNGQLEVVCRYLQRLGTSTSN